MADAALISGLLSNLAPLIKDEFSLFWNFKKEVEKLSSTLSAINAVLEDAEQKAVREKDRQTEDWLRKLKDVLYEVRDIMDECTFEDLRLQVNRRNASSSTRIQVTNSITHPFSKTWTRFKIGHKIKNVLEKLDRISSERQKLHLSQSIQIHKFNRSWRETMSLPSSSKVYGRDKELKYIIDILLNNTSSVNELYVLPIVGIGGLGKTTLAQMVYNDHEVCKHFDLKIWVCVSDEFDIKLIIKALLKEEKEGALLEELQEKVRNKLRGRRYLIVLDDVWNEDEQAWAELRSILNCGSNGAFVLATTRKINVAKIMKTITHFELSSLSDADCGLLFEQRAFLPETPKTQNLIDIGKEIAKKCKGIPLVAKTLGGQLGFTSDEKEWSRIRDTPIWEISQNENSILPILRLSYYDLPYDLRRCFVFCAIFPKDTEIEKENLIQFWMAHSLIPTVKNQEVEDVGNTIWNQLCWRSFFQDEKEEISWNEVYKTCKMHDFMHDLAQSIMKEECYTLNANVSCDDLGQKIRHLTIMVDRLDNRTLCSLKKIEGLQSLMRGAGNVNKEILNVSKKLPSLRVLEVSPWDLQYGELFYKVIRRMIKVPDPVFEIIRCSSNVQYEDLRYVGCLKYIRYLDISHSQIKTLPNSICDLLNLQTLKLNYCFKLKRLPKNTRDLINLRHLYLMCSDELNYMPRGMGQLKHLKTLSLFVIGNKEGDCQLDELKELNINGSLNIKKLERVSDASIARGISIAKKSINMLKLEWTSDDKDDEVDDNKSTRHEKICEALEVSSVSLKIVKMKGYKGMNLPRWVGNASPSLRLLQLDGLDNVNTIIPSAGAFSNLCELKIHYCPKLGRLPPHLKALKVVVVEGECSDELLDSIWNLNGTLTRLSFIRLKNDVEHILTVNNMNTSGDEMNGIEVVSFPLLEELTIRNMENLRGLVSPTIPSPGAFPNLCELQIYYCTKLGALPPHLKALKDVYVGGECTDELLYSISNLSALTHLSVNNMNERSVLFGAYGKALMFDDDEIPSSSSSSQILGELGVRSTFQSLQSLEIWSCKKLRRLFDEEMMQGLTELNISSCPELMISVEEIGKLNINNSLQILFIMKCPKLVSSEEADDVIALLRSIRTRIGPNKFKSRRVN